MGYATADVGIGEGMSVDYAQMKSEKDARLKEYNEAYAEQLQLLGYIKSLEKDNDDLREQTVTSNRVARRVRKLIKINDKDIKKYNKALKNMPPVPTFK